MIELLVEDVKFSVPLGDRYTMSIKTEADGYGSEMEVHGYELRDVWNVSKERPATTEELSLLSEFKDEIGDGIDWCWVYYDLYEHDDSHYGYDLNDCND